MTPLIFYSASQGKQPLVLSPANGFPPLVYQALLDQLAPHYQIWLTEHRPLWPEQAKPPRQLNWQLLAGDLIQQIEQQKLEPVVLIGHSLGAVLGLMAATQRPDLFQQLTLIEPVFFPARTATLLRWLPWSFKQKIPMVAKTLGRPHQFKNQQLAFAFHRRKKVFDALSDAALEHYIQYGFAANAEQNYQLRFNKQWEAAIYASLPNVWPYIRKIQVPVTGFRAEYSNTLSEKEWARWQRLRPDHQFKEFSGSEHLLPLAEPERVAKQLLQVD